MIEDADKTALFIENMAEFFRYNLSRINEDATLADEIQLVDHYIYILNVRFAGDIHYKKEIEPGLENVLVPSMILQPLVENAVQYGIRGVEWEGWVTLRIWQDAGTVYIEVADNGRGMSRELIERVLQGENVKNRKTANPMESVFTMYWNGCRCIIRRKMYWRSKVTVKERERSLCLKFRRR